MSKAFNCTPILNHKNFECSDNNFGILEFRSLTINAETDKDFISPATIAIINKNNVFSNIVNHW